MSQTYLNTGVQAGNFEDLVKFITEVNYTKTPFMSMAGKTQAKGILHEWMTQALKAGASNAVAEGATPTFAAGDVTARVRNNNNCQISRLKFSVSGTQEVVDKAGLGQTSEYDKQKDLKFKELALDMDYELLNNTGVTRDADAGTAGELKSVFEAITTNATDAGTAILTENAYNTLTQTIAEAGGDPDHVFCAGFQKRTISSWAAGIRRVENMEKSYSNTVTVYEGDFGKQAIIFDKHVPAAQIAILEIKYWNVAYLRPVESRELGLDGDLRKGYVLSEYTLEFLAENSSGKITNLATA